MSLPYQNSIPIHEPLWGEQLMVALNNYITQHAALIGLLPYTADIFVFTFPIYLVVVYVWGVIKRQIMHKLAALYIFFSSAVAVLINIGIQFFGEKTRPEQAIENKEQLILTHLPTDPFPSDHAAVSAAIAMATLLRGIKQDNALFKWLSVFFWLACLTMSVSRVAVAIHWPTDVLVGIGVGVGAAALLLWSPVWVWLEENVFAWLIALEKLVVEDLLRLR